MAYFYTLILTYKYAVLLPIAIVEGPIIMVMAAFLASLNVLNIYVVYVIGVLGDIIGDLLYYWLGRSGRYSLVPKYGHYLGITEEKIKYAEAHYEKHLIKSILFGKITQAPNVIILVTAGVVRTDLKKYLTAVGVIALVKTLLFVLVGYYFGQSYVLISHYLNNSVTALSILSVIIIILVGFYLKFKPKEI